jgi:hypothetical protein
MLPEYGAMKLKHLGADVRLHLMGKICARWCYK